MFRRFAFVVLLLLPAIAPAQQGPPTITVQVKSLDTVVDTVKLFASIAGREEVAGQIEGLIKAKVGPKGLEGIDTSRPFGAYGRFGKDLNDVSGVAMIPIADEKAFLGLLENLNLNVAKDEKTGIHTIRTGAPVDVLVRFANKYAYATALNPEAINPAQLLDPATVFPAGQKAAVAMNLRLDHLPEAVRFIVRAQMEQAITEAQEKSLPGETALQKELRMKTLRELSELANSLFSEGKEVAIDVDIDKASKDVSMSFGLTALPNTELAKSIGNMGTNKTLFGGLKTNKTCLYAASTFKMPEFMLKQFQAGFEDGLKKSVGNINDPVKRKQAEKLMNALAPTLKSGDIDGGVAFLGPNPDGQLAVVAAMKLTDGNGLGNVVKELLGELVQQLPIQEQGRVKLDFETVEGSKIHRFDFGQFYDAKARKIFGEAPIYVAFRDDALVLAVGAEGHAAMKQVLTSKTATATLPMQLEISTARLARIIADTPMKQDFLGKVFSGDDGPIRVTVEGGPKFQAKLTTKLSVIQFMAMAAVQRVEVRP